MRTANPEQAVVICDDLLDAYPDAVRALRLRGQALEALGDAARASQDYERVLDISPTDTATALSFAKALSRLGRKDEAALQAQHLLDFMPNDADAQHIAAQAVTLHVGDALPPVGRLAAARAQFAVGRNQQALNTVRKLATQSPDRLDVRLVWAEFLWRDGQRIQAADVCQQILDEQPDCLLAHALLAQVWQGQGQSMDGLRVVHVRAVNETDPDHRETEALLGPQDLFEVADVPAAPMLTGFAEEDVQDTSDDPDHEDHLNRLMGADVGPIAPQAAWPQDAGEDVEIIASEEDPHGVIGSYSPLDWERNQSQADAPVAEARADWLKALEEKSVPEPEDAPVEPPPVEPAPVRPLEWMPVASADKPESAAIPISIQAPALAIAPPAPPFTPKPSKPVRPKLARNDVLGAARNAVQDESPESAVELYRKLIKANKQVDEVLTDVMALAATQPSRDWFLLLGEAYTSKGKIEAALEAYKRANEIGD